jgi:hypothetical protein
MNERIRELELQAADGTVDPNGPFTAEEFNNFTKKFAELIVQECLEQIHIQSRGRCGDYHGEWYESDILKHFGVGE